MGRKPFDIDPDQVEKLAALGCKVEEMATFFNCSRDVLERRYKEQIERGRANVRISLRRWQLEAARKGNPTMLIWLGKQLLGQREPEKSDELVKKEAEAAGQVSAVQLDQLRTLLGFKKVAAK